MIWNETNYDIWKTEKIDCKGTNYDYNRIKKEHFYILGLILLLSIFGFLIYKVLIYKTKNNNPDTLIEANETIVDYKVPNTTICDGETFDKLKQESYKINVEYGEADEIVE